MTGVVQDIGVGAFLWRAYATKHREKEMSALKHYTHIYISYELIIQKKNSEKEGKPYLEPSRK